jgi:hypothetical protein
MAHLVHAAGFVVLVANPCVCMSSYSPSTLLPLSLSHTHTHTHIHVIIHMRTIALPQLAQREEEELRARQRAAAPIGRGSSRNAAASPGFALSANSPYVDPSDGRSSRRRGAAADNDDRDGGTRGGVGLGIGGFGDVLRSEWEVEQYMAELEEEERRQRSREATVAHLPDMFDAWEQAGRQFDPCSNGLWTTNGGRAECAGMKCSRRCGGFWGRVAREPGTIVEMVPCNCLVSVDEQHDLINPWSDVEKLIFMDKFMQVRGVALSRICCPSHCCSTTTRTLFTGCSCSTRRTLRSSRRSCRTRRRKTACPSTTFQSPQRSSSRS